MATPPIDVNALFWSDLDGVFTSLDPIERNVIQRVGTEYLGHWSKAEQKRVDALARAYAYDCPLASVKELEFRHGMWRARRAVTVKALQRTNMPAARVERFVNCGAAGSVEYSPSTRRVRCRAFYCHDRHCEACMASKRKVMRDNLMLLMDGGNCSFITLTLKHSGASLIDQLDRLLKCFRALRQQGIWSMNVKGGAFFVEVKRSLDRASWHPHLHVLVDAKFVDAGLLSQAWEKVTGDSFIVHVRRVRNRKEDIAYVTKYATKPIDESCFELDEWIDEAMVAFRGRHLLATLGVWRGRALEVRSDDPGDWKRVATIDATIDAAKRGEAWGVGLMLWLTGEDRSEAAYDAVTAILPVPGQEDPGPGG